MLRLFQENSAIAGVIGVIEQRTVSEGQGGIESYSNVDGPTSTPAIMMHKNRKKQCRVLKTIKAPFSSQLLQRVTTMALIKFTRLSV